MIARSNRNPKTMLSVMPIAPMIETSCSSGGTLRLTSSDEPRNRALASMPRTSRLTDGSRPRWSKWTSNFAALNLLHDFAEPAWKDFGQPLDLQVDAVEFFHASCRRQTAQHHFAAVRAKDFHQVEGGGGHPPGSLEHDQDFEQQGQTGRQHDLVTTDDFRHFVQGR